MGKLNQHFKTLKASFIKTQETFETSNNIFPFLIKTTHSLNIPIPFPIRLVNAFLVNPIKK